jgi:hypothetical protein
MPPQELTAETKVAELLAVFEAVGITDSPSPPSSSELALSDEELEEMCALESGEITYEQRMRLWELQIRHGDYLRAVRLEADARVFVAEVIGEEPPAEDGWAAVSRALQRDVFRVVLRRTSFASTRRPPCRWQSQHRRPRRRRTGARRSRARSPARRSEPDPHLAGRRR